MKIPCVTNQSEDSIWKFFAKLLNQKIPLDATWFYTYKLLHVRKLTYPLIEDFVKSHLIHLEKMFVHDTANTVIEKKKFTVKDSVLLSGYLTQIMLVCTLTLYLP